MGSGAKFPPVEAMAATQVASGGDKKNHGDRGFQMLNPFFFLIAIDFSKGKLNKERQF